MQIMYRSLKFIKPWKAYVTSIAGSKNLDQSVLDNMFYVSLFYLIRRCN